MDNRNDDVRLYRYASLPGPNSLRILHLNPGSGDDPVGGVLECVDLRDELQYEALSYEWGSPQKTHDALIDQGLRLKITESLHDALRDIRHEMPSGGSRTIWADAICIDQDNIEERQEQVNLMGRIYPNATRVITYIGPEADNSSLGIDFAYELLQYWDVHSKEQLDPRLHMKEEMVNLGLPPVDDPRWGAFRKLVTRGWASRCWCAQEFILNRNCIMMCGRKLVNSVFVIPTIVQLVFNQRLPSFTLPHTSKDPNSLRECLVILQGMRKAVVNDGLTSTMVNLLRACHPLRATDPRDKVYSLLAHASDNAALPTTVDYTLSVEELYTNLAAAILTLYPSTDLLYSNLGTKSLALPSWVPDWSTWRFGSHGMVNPGWYRACGHTRPNLRVDLPRRHLIIMGGLADRVSQLSEVTGADYLKAGYPHQKEWLQKQCDLFSFLESYPEGIPLSEVLWRTLIANLTIKEDEPTSQYAAYFHAFQTSNTDSPADTQDMARKYRDAVRRRLRYRRVCITAKGYFGAVPDTAQIGDWVCMFEGTRSLFVVQENGQHFVLVGTAYVHGLMNGEVFKMEGYERRTITLC